MSDRRTKAQVLDEVVQLRARLEEAVQTLQAIRSGEVDALVVETLQGARVFSLTGANHIYRLIAETMHEAALTVDLNGTILFCNRRFCELMKTSMDEVLGRKITEYVSNPQKQPLEKLLADVQAGPLQRRLGFLASDGKAVPVQLSASIIEEDFRTSICILASDLSELEASVKSIRVLREQQQALEESEHRFRAIFESSQDAIVIANDQGLCIQGNPAAMVIFGLSSEQMIGRHISEFTGNSLEKPQVWQGFLTSGLFKGEAQFTRADGRVLHLGYNAVANIMQGRHLFVIRDITERKRFEEELRSTADKNRLALESANMGMWSFDVHSRKTYWDQRTRLILGVDSGDSETYPRTLKTIHPEDRPRVDEVLKLALDPAFSGKLAAEFRVIWRDGSIHWVSSKALAWFEGEGAKRHAVRLIGTLIDITERKQAEEAVRDALSKAEEERRILEAMMEYIPMGITIAEVPDVKIRAVSRFGRELTGKPREVIEGIEVEQHAEAYGIFHLDGVTPATNEELPLTRATQQGEVVRQEEWMIARPDGTKIPVLCTAAPIRDSKGNVTGGVVGWQDITDRKLAEEEMRTHHKDLEKRVEERTAELQRKNQELQEFAFVASHDLSEPLRKIQTFGSLLEAKGSDHLSGVEKDYVSRMAGAANRMQELLDALLRYSRVESKGQEFKPSKLDDVVRDAAKDLEVVIQKIDARVEITRLPSIIGDPYQWRQLFQNLLANAVKYHRSEVKTVIKIYGEENNGTLRIFVEDNGIGFDEKYLDKIFQPFQRLHGRNEYPGTGIGLAICKKIVERHRGTITAKSTPGKGSTFIITLPTRQKKK